MPSSEFSRTLPPSVRKQLLVARIAVERVEFVQAVEQFRDNIRPASMVRKAVSRSMLGSLNPASVVLRLLDFSRGHPYLGSLMGSVFSLLLRKRLARSLFARLLKMGLIGGAVYGIRQYLTRDRAR
ncbi:hypothetical protein [Thiomonas bhubaneswarensis]|uniref:DUF3318 domain-containing protein n=1 Tax=Thiomonas bhubaneswarensis TaxID=339866 RepID=A0A0K6HQ23_9BURK|nr:hypothetical protein [Thiomonas bhubaneswarensis]CUA92903.1 Protein of unknown function (DUF3318) [Thiomonas bhubaneswarensis]